ncbi:MAG: response regulator [Spirochaetes bacterium]|nr:response regulator [Spirochaetota bacterium]
MPVNGKYRVLIVDDVMENRKILANIISKNTDYDVLLAGNGFDLIQNIDRDVPDLILLDIMMPEMDGFSAARILKKRSETKDIPIIFITSVADAESKVKAFDSGGVDYITKPFNKGELLSRVNAHLRIKKLQDDLKEKNSILENRELHLIKLVEEKTRKLESATLALINALENANFFNDNDTGNHIKRVAEYSAVIAELNGCSSRFTRRIKLYASLHDVGKVGIADAVLKKPGKYTGEEFILMQEHVRIGARMLDSDELDPMARNIALYHHEKWDGSGYVNKLKGDDIPLEARVVALADVYDALGTKRVYKDAFPEDKIDRIIGEESGRHFDPDLVEAFFKGKDKIIQIKTRLSD